MPKHGSKPHAIMVAMEDGNTDKEQFTVHDLVRISKVLRSHGCISENLLDFLNAENIKNLQEDIYKTGQFVSQLADEIATGSQSMRKLKINLWDLYQSKLLSPTEEWHLEPIGSINDEKYREI